jgi:hypothetical protein
MSTAASQRCEDPVALNEGMHEPPPALWLYSLQHESLQLKASNAAAAALASSQQPLVATAGWRDAAVLDAGAVVPKVLDAATVATVSARGGGTLW